MEVNQEKNIIRLNVEDDGFCGFFQKAQTEENPGTAVIVLADNDGNHMAETQIASMFSKRGISALALSYYGVKGLGQDPVLMPIESIEQAVSFLISQGYEKPLVYGFSTGAELALLAASYIPKIAGVIAVSPMHCVWNGKERKGNSMFFSDHSEFTWRGKELPCLKAKLNYWPAFGKLIREGQMNMSYIYEKPLFLLDEKTVIHVERIRGDLFFIYPKEDTVWPSRIAVEAMIERLKKKKWPGEVSEICYEKASHMLAPIQSDSYSMIKVERKYPEDCYQNRIDAFEKAVEWIKRR